MATLFSVEKEDLEPTAREAQMFLFSCTTTLKETFRAWPVMVITYLTYRFQMKMMGDDRLLCGALQNAYRDAREQSKKTGTITPRTHAGLFCYLREAERRLKKAKSRKMDRLYQLVELASFLLPRQARVETFEPYYHNLKGDCVRACQRYKGKWARRWLAFCFLIHSTLTIGNCFWVLLGAKGRSIILRLLPDVVRRFWGG